LLTPASRRAELKERSEEEHARDAEEKKKAFQEMQAKLSEVKGRDVKELDEDVERRYTCTLSLPLLSLLSALRLLHYYQESGTEREVRRRAHA
jgi:hypothetical protein